MSLLFAHGNGRGVAPRNDAESKSPANEAQTACRQSSALRCWPKPLVRVAAAIKPLIRFRAR
jgi:hypothetical protein